VNVQVIAERTKVYRTSGGIVLSGCVRVLWFARIIVVYDPTVGAYGIANRTGIENETACAVFKIFGIDERCLRLQ
jgi:hypothetical protein